MGIYNVTAIPTAGAQVSSAFGSAPWSASASNISAQVPVGQGAAWRVWQVLIANAVPGESFNGVRIAGGTVDFTVGGGGTGIQRYATFYADLEFTLNAFIDKAGQNAGNAVQGSGIGRPVDAVVTDGRFTSTDLVNGTFYVGISVDTGSEEPGLGDGTARFSAFNWTFYTGADSPNPPPTVPNGRVTNPASNTSPGALPGAKLASLDYTTTSAGGRSFANASWVLPAGLTWDANGTQNLSQSAASQTISTGQITVNPATLPGVYQGSVTVSGYDNPSGTVGPIFFQLVVASPSQGGWFFEI
jgi:hypothetical protein